MDKTMVCVPVEPTEAMLRPFYHCPPEELPLAWEAACLIGSRIAAPAPQPVQGEAVAWMDDFGNAFPLSANKGAGSWRDEHKRNWRPLFTQPPAPAVGVQIAAPGDVEARAKELLAVEYERDGRWKLANCLRDGETTCCSETAIRAISASLRSQGQADAVVECKHAWVSDGVNPTVCSRCRITSDAALAQQANKGQP